MKGKTVRLASKVNRDNSKEYWYFEYGRKSGERIASNLFTYISPASREQRKHNKEISGLLNTELASKILDLAAGRSPFLINARRQTNFLKYFEDWVKTHSPKGNRHAMGCIRVFKEFINKGSGHPRYIFLQQRLYTLSGLWFPAVSILL